MPTIEKIRDILEGCDDVTPGPWATEQRSIDEVDGQRYMSLVAALVLAPDMCAHHPLADCSCNHTCGHDAEANAAHIARLDPATVRTLCSVWLAALGLVEDVRRRHPGKDLRCPHMRALDAALRGLPHG